MYKCISRVEKSLNRIKYNIVNRLLKEIDYFLNVKKKAKNNLQWNKDYCVFCYKIYDLL